MEIAIARQKAYPDRSLATIAARSARAAKLIAADGHVFALRPPHVPQGVDAVLVLIDIDEELIEGLHERLTQDFIRGAEDWILPGVEETYVSLLLHRVPPLTADSSQTPAMAIAVWVNGEVVIGYRGTARAYLARNGALVEPDLPRQRRSDGHEVHVGRIVLAPADRLALMSSAVVGCLRHEELQSALLANGSVDDTAGSLATLASARADRVASALIAEFVMPPSGPQNPVRPPAPRRRWRQWHLLWLALAVAMIVVILLLTAMLIRSSSKPHAARAESLQAPTALRSRQISATQVMFSWRAVPHATAYLLGVGQDQFYTRIPSATVSDILQPGRSYGWWVQSKLQSKMGPKSESTSLRLRPLPARSWRFYPLTRPVDQVLLSLYNPNTIAGDAQIQVRDAISGRNRVHVAPHSATEIGVLPSKAGNRGLALTVRASVPIVVQRVAIRSSTTQSAYGIPEAPTSGS